MKKIYEYGDYRSLISDYYAERKAREAFTWRDFAKDAGFSSPVYLKQVSEGKFNLSDDAAERVARAMGFEEDYVRYFGLLVCFNHAKRDSEKKEFLKQMFAIAKSHKEKILEGDAFKFFDDWKHSVIRELAPSMPGAKPLEMAHACRPKVTAAEVSESLSFLLKANILKKDEAGNYAQAEKIVTTGPMKITPVAVRDLHRQMGELALDAIEGVEQDKRHFSGVTFGLSQKSYEQIVNEIDAFRKKIIAIATCDDECDEVYRMNIQFFPMTCKNVK